MAFKLTPLHYIFSLRWRPFLDRLLLEAKTRSKLPGNSLSSIENTNLALTYLEAGDSEKARNHALLLPHSPFYRAISLYIRAGCNLLENRLEVARSLIEDAITLASLPWLKALCLLKLGYIYLRLKNPSAAQAQFIKAIQLIVYASKTTTIPQKTFAENPEEYLWNLLPNAQHGLALSYIGQNRKTEIAQLAKLHHQFHTIFKKNDWNETAQPNSDDYITHCADYGTVLYTSCDTCSPQFRRIYLQKAAKLLKTFLNASGLITDERRQKTEEKIRSIEEILAADRPTPEPAQDAMPYYLSAQAHRNAQRFQEALKDFFTAFSLAKSDVLKFHSLFDAGCMLFEASKDEPVLKIGDLNQAIAYFRQALCLVDEKKPDLEEFRPKLDEAFAKVEACIKPHEPPPQHPSPLAAQFTNEASVMLKH